MPVGVKEKSDPVKEKWLTESVACIIVSMLLNPPETKKTEA